LIFTTAHDEFAIAAFEAAAIDYLLKPIEEARLRRAVERVQARRMAQDPGRLVAALQGLLQHRALRSDRPRVHARRGDALCVFDAESIVRFRAEDKYTAFLQDGQEYLSEESLQSLERRLAAYGFFRSHRSELIALNSVSKLLRSGDNHEVELRDGQRAAVSRRALPDLRRLLGIEVPKA
jgi:two-component system LytT family response regulator